MRHLEAITTVLRGGSVIGIRLSTPLGRQRVSTIIAIMTVDIVIINIVATTAAATFHRDVQEVEAIQCAYILADEVYPPEYSLTQMD
jgi:Mn2+/Fe2+ NRAMP family transporter